ncbi:DUF4389 domain-containing protein [Sulfuriflexus mobilis]|uniref:DUF4389 domain-containing protein n=1 Tax=Sulfuriflexus mobilis TaxID=1811807 RepID=UPI000F8336D3|nr:DUF4389 domain-containing protein [Sulfuriflexus mobilis]
MDDNIKKNLKETTTWVRALYMLMYVIIYWVTEIIIGVVIFFQFLSVLITSSRNEKLLTLGQSLSTYIYQIMTYLTFNSEARPYPVGDWPTGAPSENVTETSVLPEAKAKAKGKDKATEDSADKDADTEAS